MKKIGTCPTCSRDIESGDDVREVGGVVYHEECAPEAPENTLKSQLKAADQPKEGGKKVKKPTTDEVIRQLLDVVGNLTKEVEGLKQARAAAPARAHKPKSEKGCPRPHVYYVVEGFPSEKRPPQCIRVYRAIAQATPADHRMTELDVWNALMAEPFPSAKPNPKLGAWNHVQTPYYIFKYYRADMINAEYVKGPFDVVVE